MLPRPHRIRKRSEFDLAMRTGRRAGRDAVVITLAGPSVPGEQRGCGPPRVGFVVGKAVGNAVVRNRVRRRLRELARERICTLPAGSLLVVRAKPAAANHGYQRLAHQLDSALASVQRPRQGRRHRTRNAEGRRAEITQIDG